MWIPVSVLIVIGIACLIGFAGDIFNAYVEGVEEKDKK
jgi:hypothetical protein